MAQIQFSSNFYLIDAQIQLIGDTGYKNIMDLIVRFDYFEDILMPTISATLDLVDTGYNLVSSIQGFEKVKIELQDSFDKKHRYEFRVYKIYNRFTADRFQKYTLGLMSLEALLNEGIRIPKTLSGKAETIISQMLKDNIKTNKDFNYDKTKFDIKYNPGKRTPFSIIDSIKNKAVPNDSTNQQTTNSNLNLNKTESNSASSLINSSENKLMGTGGYLFYENKNGFNFRSIDSLCSTTSKFNGTPPVAIYTQENISVGGNPAYKILDIDFVEEIDILSKLRTGAFSSLICFYNHSTGSYEEYTYSLANSYDNMAHLGKQEKLPQGQRELSKYPTRIMSVVLDHELWFNEATIASAETNDRKGINSTSSAPYQDFQKYFMAQSISRINSLVNQQVNIKIPGNPSLVAGDKIEIRIPNQIPTANRSQQPYDETHSGVYLIKSVNNVFMPKSKKTFTFLTLIRDSYGKTVSNVR
jgi:hypothetical protein